MTDRSIPFSGVQNCRTLGGLPTSDGHTVADGRLYRAAYLAEAADSDLERLGGELHVSLIVDLRTSREAARKPDRAVPGARALHLPVFDERKEGVSHEEDTEPGPPGEMPPMEEVYRFMVSDEGCRANLGRALRAIMEHVSSGDTALWHCTEGKDRCGLVSAFLLSALGVERSLIREDYLLTNRVNGPKADRIRAELIDQGKTPAEADRIHELVLAKESYFDAAFAVVDERGVDAFLREALAIPEDTLRAFRAAALH